MKPTGCDINLIAMHDHEVTDLVALLGQVGDWLRECDHDAPADLSVFCAGGGYRGAPAAAGRLIDLIGGHTAVLTHRLQRATR